MASRSRKKTFDIKPYNTHVNTDLVTDLDEINYFKERGVGFENENGGFDYQVIFVSRDPGFVVQRIQRETTVNKVNKTTKQYEPYISKREEYWEIFYIDRKEPPYQTNKKYFKSGNPDSFAQKPIKNPKNTTGKITIIGTSYFYPYDGPIEKTKQTDKFKKASFNKIKELFNNDNIIQISKGPANGLPFSTDEITGTDDFKHCGKVIIRTLVAEWPKGEKPTKFDKKNAEKDSRYDKGWIVDVKETFKYIMNGKTRNITRSFKRPKDFENQTKEDGDRS